MSAVARTRIAGFHSHLQAPLEVATSCIQGLHAGREVIQSQVIRDLRCGYNECASGMRALTRHAVRQDLHMATRSLGQNLHLRARDGIFASCCCCISVFVVAPRCKS